MSKSPSLALINARPNYSVRHKSLYVTGTLEAPGNSWSHAKEIRRSIYPHKGGYAALSSLHSQRAITKLKGLYTGFFAKSKDIVGQRCLPG